MKYFLIMPVLVALVFAAEWFLDHHRERHCPSEVVEKTPIAATDWIVQTREQACGFGIGAMADIRVVKSDGRGAVVLATGESIDQASFDGSVPGQLHITLPAGRDIQVHQAKVPGLAIDFTYKPTPAAASDAK